MMWCCMIWCDMTCIYIYMNVCVCTIFYHIITYHIMSCVICHIILYYTISYHVIPYHTILCYAVLGYHIIWFQFISHITSNIVSCQVMSISREREREIDVDTCMPGHALQCAGYDSNPCAWDNSSHLLSQLRCTEHCQLLQRGARCSTSSASRPQGPTGDQIPRKIAGESEISFWAVAFCFYMSKNHDSRPAHQWHNSCSNQVYQCLRSIRLKLLTICLNGAT